MNFFSSFNDKPVNEAVVGPIGKELFEREQEDLLSDLKDIPKKACDRRVSWVFSCLVLFLDISTLPCNYHLLQLQINEFVKRARAAKIHAYIISHLKKEMPAMMGKAKTQQRLIDDLEDEFAKVVFCSLYATSEAHLNSSFSVSVAYTSRRTAVVLLGNFTLRITKGLSLKMKYWNIVLQVGSHARI